MLILNVITLANLILLFSLLYFRKENSLPNKILALILINPGVNFLSNLTVLSEHFYEFPYFYFFAQCTAFLFAPLVYTYVNLFINKRIKLTDPLFIITAGCIGMVIFFTVDFLFQSSEWQREYLTGILKEPYPLEMVITNGLFILMQQVYFTVSAIRVYRYKNVIYQNLSNFEKIRWKYISRFIIIIWILNLITIVLYLTLPMVQVEYVILPLALTAIYFYILIYSFNQNSIFSKQDYEVYQKDNNVSTVNMALKEDVGFKEELIKNTAFIERFFNEQEPYTNPNLTLETLSQETGIPINRLSMTINKGLNKNFYDLINERRVEKSKLLLREMNAQTTIEYVAYESGFNSRASFYRAFKKHTGITPTEFLKNKAA